MIFSVINPGKPSDADTSQWASKMANARAAGATWCTATMPWSMMQSTAGGSVSSGVTKMTSYLDAAQAAGLKVVIDLSLHYPPTFVTSGVEQFKDQNGTLWSDTNASGNNVRNWQWTQQGRDYVADLLARIGTAGLAAHPAIAGVRLGGGYAGEAHYAPITTSPLQWWIFGASCQTGAGIADDLGPVPVPGRTPLFDGSDNTADEAIGGWWLDGMSTWVGWLVSQVEAAGFGTGDQHLWVLHPSTGVRDRPHTDLAWKQEVARGVDPRRLIAAYTASQSNVWPWSTWIDPGSNTTETGMGSGTYVLEQARQLGKLEWAAGENTHTDSDLAGCLAVAQGRSVDSPHGAQARIFNWLSYDSLVGGAVGDVTLAQFQAAAAAKPSGGPMAGRTLRFDVTNTPTLATSSPGDGIAGHTLAMYNPVSNTQSVWSGYSNAITPGTTKATDGFEIPPGATKEWDLADVEGVYFVTTSGTVTIYIDEVGI